MIWAKVGNVAGKHGLNGRDADEAAIAERVFERLRESVRKEVASMPVPKDGKSVDPEFVRSVVRDEVALAVSALPPPAAGQDGKSVDLAALSVEIIDAAAKAVAALPRAKDGEPGPKPAPEDLAPIVADAVQKAVRELPPPKHGERGADGIGIDKVVVGDKTFSLILTDGNQADIELPVGPRGEKGDAVQGVRGEKGDPPSTDEVAAAITKACDALLPAMVSKHIESLMPEIITRASLLVPPGRDGLPGRPGSPGEDGRDGAGIKDISIYQLDRRRSEVAFALTDGREVKAGLHMEGMLIDADVHRSGEQYEKGDAVTHSGSYWVAKCDTNATPGKSDDWRMVVKRGRDGRDAPGAEE